MPVTVYFDETGTHTGSQRIMVGAVVTLHAEQLEAAVDRRKQEVAADSSLWPVATKRPQFASEGFHHAVDDETVRDRFIETMRTLDYRAHVCCSHRGATRGGQAYPTVSGLADADLLVVMYYSVLRNLMRRYSGETIEFIFETKSDMDSLYGRIVRHAMSSLDRFGAPRAVVSARIGDKPLGGLAVVDYALALTELFIQHQDGSDVEAFKLARFQRVGSHMADLIDFDAATHRSSLTRLL